mgnify:CR=1 FL=1
MICGKTASGFEFTLEEEVLDNYELLETLAEIDQGNYGKLTEMTTLLLGEEQKDSLKEHVRNDKGKISIKKMMDEISEIFKSAKETGKNS